MKEVTPPFRLYDFLAYLFPGMATLHVLYLHGASTQAMLTGFLTSSTVFNYAMLILTSYVIGLFWSVVSRDVIRRLCWLIYNPRIDHLNPRKFRRTPLGPCIIAGIKSHLAELYPTEAPSPRDAYVLCRCYVSHNCPSSWARRTIVTSIRAMAANFIGPTVMYATFFFSNGNETLGWVAVVAAVALLRKTVTHDAIEWKEIYASFLSHRTTGRVQSSPEHG